MIIKDVVIDSNTFFNDTAEAKAHVADKALKYIRREWHRSGLPTSHGGSLGQVTVKNQVEDLARRQEELRRMLKQRHETKSAEPLQSNASVSASVDMSDPAQARAFVEGFKVGQLAAQREAAGCGSSPPSIPQSRGRSRSPGRGRSSSQSKAGEAYRQRSPIRDGLKTSHGALSPPRYFDGSRHGVCPQVSFLSQSISVACVLRASYRPWAVFHKACLLTNDSRQILACPRPIGTGPAALLR